MADLTIQINEKITLNGNDRGVYSTQTIPGINGVDNRLLTIPTGSYTGLFYFSNNNPNAATFSKGNFKYGRITNKSTVPVKLAISTDNTNLGTFIIDAYSSFTLSNVAVSSSIVFGDTFIFDDFITEIGVQPSGSSAVIEYFIATT